MNSFRWPAGRVLASGLFVGLFVGRFFGPLCMAAAGLFAWPAPASAQAILSMTSNPQTTPPTMKQALDAAWQRSAEAAQTKGQQARAQAEQTVAQSWWAAPLAVNLGQREGGRGTPAGKRETELGLALPLWRPGLRAAGGQAADAQTGLAQAAEQAARWRLAGQLRDAAAAVRSAEVDLRQAKQQTANLEQVAQDVERRLNAGDLAPADALAARAEYLAAQAQQRTTVQAAQAQWAGWRLLTGLNALPQAEAPPVATAQTSAAPALPDTHPELLAVNATLALAQRRLDVAQRYRPPPELTLGTRQERPGQGAAAQQSWAVGLRVPVGSAAHWQPRIAEALGELDLAQTEAQRTRDRLAADLALAVSQLQVSQAQLQAERERAALLSERARLIDKSFRAGETPLPELLRALGAAAAAEAAHARQQVAQQLAAARLQQAQGFLP